MRARPAVLALLISVAVDAVPFVGPHAVTVLGEWIVRGDTRGDRATAWIASEVAAALTLQAVAAATWYWILLKPRSPRPLVLVALVPAGVVAMNWLFMLVLPARFLIERDAAPERATWSVACAVPNESVVVVGRKPAVVRPPGDPVFVQNAAGRLARLVIGEAPGGGATCEVASLGLPPASANFAPAWSRWRSRPGGGRAIPAR